MTRLRMKLSVPVLAITMAACTTSDGSPDPDVVDPFPPATIAADASTYHRDAGATIDGGVADGTHQDAATAPTQADAEAQGADDAGDDVDAEAAPDAAEPEDAAPDAAAEAETDAAVDSGIDAGAHAGADAGASDAGLDGGMDAALDAGLDASVTLDASTDASVMLDASTDASAAVDAAAPDTRVCSIALTTTAPAGRYNPAYVCAIWIEDTAGKLVRTLAYFANRRATYLSAYKTALGTGTVDGTTSATINADGLPNFDIVHHNLKWNTKSSAGVEVPDGTYRVRVELTSKNGAGAVTSIDLTKSTGAFGGTAADTVNTVGFALSCPAAP